MAHRIKRARVVTEEKVNVSPSLFGSLLSAPPTIQDLNDEEDARAAENWSQLTRILYRWSSEIVPSFKVERNIRTYGPSYRVTPTRPSDITGSVYVVFSPQKGELLETTFFDGIINVHQGVDQNEEEKGVQLVPGITYDVAVLPGEFEEDRKFAQYLFGSRQLSRRIVQLPTEIAGLLLDYTLDKERHTFKTFIRTLEAGLADRFGKSLSIHTPYRKHIYSLSTEPELRYWVADKKNVLCNVPPDTPLRKLSWVHLLTRYYWRSPPLKRRLATEFPLRYHCPLQPTRRFGYVFATHDQTLWQIAANIAANINKKLDPRHLLLSESEFGDAENKRPDGWSERTVLRAELSPDFLNSLPIDLVDDTLEGSFRLGMFSPTTTLSTIQRQVQEVRTMKPAFFGAACRTWEGLFVSIPGGTYATLALDGDEDPRWKNLTLAHLHMDMAYQTWEDEWVTRFFVKRVDTFQIFVKGYEDTTYTFDVCATTRVSHLRARIRDRTATPTESIRLIFAGKQLEDLRSLQDYGASDASTFHMVGRLR